MTPGDFILHQGDHYSRELADFSPAPPVDRVYNPLIYARAPWAEYLHRFAREPKQTVFLGMNPGPWGMAQTGIPFGEVAAVRDWMQIDEPVVTPQREHPKRPIEGFACTRSEVSGRRLWTLFGERFGTADRFFQRNMVINYCPLVFMAESGRNITPDRLRAAERDTLFSLCDRFLADTIAALQPSTVVGIGAFARKRLDAIGAPGLIAANARAIAAGVSPSPSPDHPTIPRAVTVLHPSPASPAANRGWADAATGQLIEAGVWADGSE